MQIKTDVMWSLALHAEAVTRLKLALYTDDPVTGIVATESPWQLSKQGKGTSAAVAVVPDLPPLPAKQQGEQ
jgi:hypothetical protein